MFTRECGKIIFDDATWWLLEKELERGTTSPSRKAALLELTVAMNKRTPSLWKRILSFLMVTM